jgi:hypothetical protein
MRVARLSIVAVLATLSVHAGVALAQAQTVDFSSRVTPACEFAGLTVKPPAGWINVPFDKPPKGHRGCQLMRINEREELVGIIRVRSATEPTAEFKEEGFGRLLANEAVAVSEMGYVLARESLWARENVPVSGAGFRDGRAVGVAARITGNDVPQEAHFLVFRSDDAKYVFTLLTPQQSYSESLYQRNSSDFGVVIRSLQPARR